MPDRSKGYIGTGSEEGTFVPEEDAYIYAMERCQIGTGDEVKEFRGMLVEWYYSGNWIKAE